MGRRLSVVNIDIPELYDKQRRAIFAPERYSWIEASTKAGKTFGCIIWLLVMALRCKAGQNVWWVAPVGAQAQIAFERLRAYLPRSLYKENLTEKSISIKDAGKIWFKGADRPDSLYGEDVYAAVIDEASRVKSDAWTAVRSTLTATQAPLRIIGNVKGRSNWFYKGSRRAQQGAKGHHYAKLTAYDAAEAGIFPVSEIEDARETLPEHVFKELYLAEPSDDGGNPFGLDAIDDCLAPLAPGPPVVWGWDLARSTDWTVGFGLNAEGKVCEFHRFQKDWPATERTIVDLTDGVDALVDSTGVGDVLIQYLQRHGRNFEGYTFTPKSKQYLMEGLSTAIQGRKTTVLDNEHKSELDTFEYEYNRTGVKYSAPSGLHDDCVCSHALAWHHYDGRYRVQQNQPKPTTVGTLPNRGRMSKKW